MMSLKNNSILIIDRNKDNARLLHSILHGRGYIVESAESYTEAEIKLNETLSSDLLLLDFSLVPGSEAAGQSIAGLMADMPVIFLYDDDSALAKIYKAVEWSRTCGYLKRNSGENLVVAAVDAAFRIILQFRQSDARRDELEIMSEDLQAAVEELEESNAELASANSLLTESEARFHTVFQNSPIPIAISVLKDGTYLDVNARFVEITGMTREAAIGKKTSDVIRLVNPGDESAILREFADKGIITGFPLVTENLSGVRSHSLLSVFPVEINNVLCAVSMLTDISSIKCAEQKLLEKDRMLAEANSMLNLVIDTIPGHIYWKNRNLEFSGANMRFARDAGFTSPDDLTGLRSEDLVLKDGFISDESEDIDVMNSGIPVLRGVVPYTTRGGEHRWYRKNKIPLRNTAGDTIGILCSYDDVTQSKLNEEELAKSRAQLQGIFDASIVGVALLRNRVFVKVNAALCKTLGYTENELLDHDVRMIYPDDEEYKRVGIELYRGLTEKGQAVVEARMVTRDGRLIDTLISSSPVDHNNPDGDICASLNDITELKKAENEAREKEQRLRVIASNVPGIIYQFYADDNGRYNVSFMSDKAPVLFGINASDEDFFDEFVSRMHKDDRQRFFDSISKSVEFMSQWEFEGRFVKNSGEIMWIRAMSSPVRHKDRTVFNGVIIDVTDRKIVEEELSRREDRFRSMIQSAQDLIFIVDRNNLLTYESPSVSKILGYEEGFFIGLSPFQLVHPDDLDLVMKDMALVYNSNNPGTPTSFRFKHSDGRWIYLEAVASNLLSNNAVNGIVITARDITERKLAADALIMSESKFRNIFENMSVGYFRTGLDGSILDANPACLKILGFESVEDARKFLGNRSSNIYADRHEWKRVRDSVMAHPDPPVMIVRFKRKNGTEFTAELKMKIVSGIDGARMNVEGLIEDVTQRIKTQEILIQSEKMMTVAGLAAGMAHEINNPLGIIMQNAENAMHRLLDNLPGNIQAAEDAGIDFSKLARYIGARRINQYLLSIKEAGARAARIVGNMLQFSRGTDSMFDYLDINTVLDKTLDLASNDYDITRNYDFRKIKIVKRFSLLPQIRCTESQIEQVFLNILKNAAQAMNIKQYDSDEDPVIIITTVDKNDFVEITFSDNGPGMDENTRKRIFEPFFTTKLSGSGTGLGLSVSYYIIVNGHGGTITAESSPGNGTSFIITLPAGKGAE